MEQGKTAQRRLPRLKNSTSSFYSKPHNVQQYLINNPNLFPIATVNLAALHIQRMVRGFLVRRRLQNRGASPRLTTKVMAAKKPGTTADTRQQLYNRYLQEVQLLQRRKGYSISFPNWCACRIQAVFRMHRQQRRYRYCQMHYYNIAAAEIQNRWLVYRYNRISRARNEDYWTFAAISLQRAWRSFTARRVYRYYRDLVVSNNASDPVLLLKMLAPKESALADNASGLYVRFRLGGAVFPPTIYYKVYTSQSITDIGAFAPRNYVDGRKQEREKGEPCRTHLHIYKGSNGGTNNRLNKGNTGTGTGTGMLSKRGGGGGGGKDGGYQREEPPPGWYRRVENNGWKPLTNQLFRVTDEIEERTRHQPVPFHHNRLTRQVDVLKKRKQIKLKWLQSLYRLNPPDSGERGGGGGGGGGERGGGSSPIAAVRAALGKQGRTGATTGRSYGSYLKDLTCSDSSMDVELLQRSQRVQLAALQTDPYAALHSKRASHLNENNSSSSSNSNSSSSSSSSSSSNMGGPGEDTISGGLLLPLIKNNNNKNSNSSSSNSNSSSSSSSSNSNSNSNSSSSSSSSSSGGVNRLDREGNVVTDVVFSHVVDRVLAIRSDSSDVFNLDWEDEADELLTWSENLDFENYQDQWYTIATSKPAQRFHTDTRMVVRTPYVPFASAGRQASAAKTLFG